MSWLDQYYTNDNLPWVEDSTVLLVRHGSQAYGTSTPTSDLDVKGVAIPPRRYFHGFINRFEQVESKNPIDCVIYDIRKFFNLAADCNPNIIEVLWADPSDYLFINAWGKLLVQKRVAFLSQKAKHTFSGYAIAQLKRIRTHRKWLLDPPTEQPKRSTYGLPETTLLDKSQLGAIEAVERNSQPTLSEIPHHVMEVYEKERAYHNALTEWNQYQNWKQTRNPARAALEAQFGYDCKHAMHLVRLMRMCREILTTGQVIVKRPDAEELLAIRHGAWEYDMLVDWAEKQDEQLNELAKTSFLPHAPDRVKLDQICQEIVESHFTIRDRSVNL